MSRASQSNPATRRSFKGVDPTYTEAGKDWAYWIKTGRNKIAIAVEKAKPGKQPRVVFIIQSVTNVRALMALELTQLTETELNSFYLLASKAHELALPICSYQDGLGADDDNGTGSDDIHRISSASWASGLDSEELLQRLADDSARPESDDSGAEPAGSTGVTVVEPDTQGDVTQDDPAESNEPEGIRDLFGLDDID